MKEAEAYAEARGDQRRKREKKRTEKERKRKQKGRKRKAEKSDFLKSCKIENVEIKFIGPKNSTTSSLKSLFELKFGLFSFFPFCNRFLPL